MRSNARTPALLLGAALLVAACQSPESSRPAVDELLTPTPSVEEELCQPFPDQLFDDFLTAYGERDLEALTSLVRTEEIHDFTAIAAAGRVEFDGVAAWARSGWEAGDRLKAAGYGAFGGGDPGTFVMYLIRRNDALRDAAIPELAILLEAGSSGCTIDELSVVGPAQARGAPCRFYEVFGGEAALDTDEPPSCVDGSGTYARVGHDAVWAGNEMIVLGGTRGGHFQPPDPWERGLRLQEGADWRPTADVPRSLRSLTRAAWSGNEVLIWGGWWGEGGAGAYDPADDRWRVFTGWPLRRADNPPGVWTGEELIVWGSSGHTDQPQRRAAILDPDTGSWRWSAPAPIGGRAGHVAVWTGTEMVAWGGSDYETDLSDGAVYTPSTDSWRTITDAPLSPRQDAAAVWTGEELLVGEGAASAALERTEPPTIR
jgi:hypothetical protein